MTTSASKSGTLSGLSETAKLLIKRLRRGQQWLTAQHRSWLTGTLIVDDPRFTKALEGWDALERVVRCSGYWECIWSSNGSCPDDAPVVCDHCAKTYLENL